MALPKNAQGLPLQVMVIALLALFIAAVVLIITGTQTNKTNDYISGDVCPTDAQVDVDKSCPSGTLRDPTKKADEDKKCCVESII